MSTTDRLRPVRKLLVMDLLREAGIDVSLWKNYKGGSPAANPRYCYNWSFEQPGELVAVCLWHNSLKLKNGRIIFQRSPRALASMRSESGPSIWKRRAADFGRH